MKSTISLWLLTCATLPLMAQKTVEVSVVNPSSQVRNDQPVVLQLERYGQDIRSALVMCEGQEIPCQLDDLNQDDNFDELCFLADLGKKEQKHYTVTLYTEGAPRPYPARVYAEMVMANTKDKTLKKNQQNNYRQTLDLYGKFNKQLELKETQFYTDADQKARGYGDDVLWVGKTFGLGAFRGWDGKQPTLVEPVRSRTQRIISYGPLRTIVELVDRGWQAPSAISHQPSPINMTLRYTQYAGHRDTDVDVLFNKDVSDYRFSTGIINVKGSEEFTDKKGLRACWGTDYPSTDTLKWKRETVGLAVLVPQQNIVSEEPANKDNYAYIIKVAGNRMHYKVNYTSANETFGYHSAKEWFDYLKAWRREVEEPLQVRVKN